MDKKDICRISDAAWVVKDQWTPLLRECYEHGLSDRNPYFQNGTGRPQGKSGTQGQDKTSRKVFDSTLAADCVMLANRLQYELFPIGSKWAEFTPGPFIAAEQQQEARGELELLRETIFTAIALSNFDLSIAEWLLELVVSGTACMLVQKGDEDDPVIYQCVPQSHVAFREGAFGRIDFISRKSKIRHSVLDQTWVGAKVPALAEGAKEDPECDVIDVCYLDNKTKRWQMVVIVEGGLGNKEKVEIYRATYRVNPWVIARWSKAAGEAQGRGLVMLALPDARVLSSVKSYLLRNAALAVGGAFLVKNDGSVNANSVRIYPGATIPVRNTGGPNGASVAPLQVGGDVNLAQLIIEDLIGSIHKIMLNDGMPEIKDGVRSATEVIERLKRLQQSLGAPFSRVLKEGIIPILECTISTLAEMGVIQMDASRKIKLNNGQISVRFTSPVVQGQQLRDVETAMQAIAMTQQVGGNAAAEVVGLNYKVEDVGAWIGNKLGVDPRLMRTPAERKQLQEQAGQVAAAQMGGGAPVGPGAMVPPGGQMAAPPMAMAA